MLQLGLTWFAPFFSGGGYCSEVRITGWDIDFAMGREGRALF